MVWSHVLPDQNVDGLAGNIGQGAPIVANFKYGEAAVVGDTGGHLWAFYLGNGKAPANWPVTTGTPITGGIDGVPSATTLPGFTRDTVFIGLGAPPNFVKPPFGYMAFQADGHRLWQQRALDQFGSEGAMAGMTIWGGAQHPNILGPSLLQMMYNLNATNGAPVWSFATEDTDYSTAAVGDLYGNGTTVFVNGGDSTFNPDGSTANGGHVRILSSSGRKICELEPQPDQTVSSSPAIGKVFNGSMGIVVGTGDYPPYAGGTDTDRVLALNPNCTLRWSARLNGTTLASPALANVEGTPGRVQAVETTSAGSGTPGEVYVLDPNTGHVLPGWPKPTTGPIVGNGSPVTADLSGLGYQDIVVPTITGTDIFDGKSGKLIADLGAGQIGTQSTPLITKDANGVVGITVAGYEGTTSNCPLGESVCLQGVVSHYQVSTSGAQIGPSDQSWPMFHHDRHLSGNLQSTVGP